MTPMDIWIIALCATLVGGGLICWVATKDLFFFVFPAAIATFIAFGYTFIKAAPDSNKPDRPRTPRQEFQQSGIICSDRHRSDQTANHKSGNVCRVRVGDLMCVAVLPDGGKAPRYKPEWIKCDD